MTEESRKAKALQETIRQILLRVWDPIGVNDIPEARDEYDSYVGGVYRMLAAGCSADQMIGYLLNIESQQMGLMLPNREVRREVANQLIALDISL